MRRRTHFSKAWPAVMVQLLLMAALLAACGEGEGVFETATTETATSVVDSSTTSSATTAATTSTTAAATTSTTAASTTTSSTTSSSTTTTTTAPPFAGTLDQKTGTVHGTPGGRLLRIRSAAHSDFTRVVFDFAPGGIPGYWIGYTDATHLSVIVFPMDWSNPYDAGIFDGDGVHPIATGSVVAVLDAGMGGGSGEWGFDIVVSSQKPFLVGTEDGPPRIYVDIAD